MKDLTTHGRITDLQITILLNEKPLSTEDELYSSINI